jgi:hypothetical protein
LVGACTGGLAGFLFALLVEKQSSHNRMTLKLVKSGLGFMVAIVGAAALDGRVTSAKSGVDDPKRP